MFGWFEQRQPAPAESVFAVIAEVKDQLFTAVRELPEEDWLTVMALRYPRGYVLGYVAQRLDLMFPNADAEFGPKALSVSYAEIWGQNVAPRLTDELPEDQKHADFQQAIEVGKADAALKASGGSAEGLRDYIGKIAPSLLALREESG